MTQLLEKKITNIDVFFQLKHTGQSEEVLRWQTWQLSRVVTINAYGWMFASFYTVMWFKIWQKVNDKSLH